MPIVLSKEVLSPLRFSHVIIQSVNHWTDFLVTLNLIVLLAP